MELYYTPISAPCRSVLMTAKAIGIDLQTRNLNLFAGEHLQPQFLHLNPQHTVPTLVDNGFVMWESRPILIYLVEQYAKTDSLYPNDAKLRAQINQRLYFDMGTLFSTFVEYYLPQVFTKAPPDPDKYKNIEAAFTLLNTMLERRLFAVGTSLTLADIAWLASISTFDVVGFNFSKYTNVVNWYENVKRITPGWKENWEGCLGFKQIFNK